MTKLEAKDNKPETVEATSLDEALLEEFFSVLASIAVRLTKIDVRAKNGFDSTQQEGKEQ